MAYIMLILYLCSCGISLFVGFRLGRYGSAGKSSRCSNSSASSGLAAAEEIEAATDAAIRANATADEILQKMRDIIQRHSNNTSGDTSNTRG